MRRPAVTAALAAAVLILAVGLTTGGPGLVFFVLYTFVILLLAAGPLAALTWLATRWWRWFDAPTLLASAWLACVVTGATLSVPQTASSRAQARSLEYGYPFRFAESDASFFSYPPYPQTVAFNPWETPMHFDGIRFALSALVFYVLLLAVLALGARVAWPRYARRSVRSAGPSA